MSKGDEIPKKVTKFPQKIWINSLETLRFQAFGNDK